MINNDILQHCTLCPRKCNIDRLSAKGFCGAGAKLRVARAALHMWEEPCISGTNGSGAVFFSYCNLGCIYCQNFKISHEGFGKDITVAKLCNIFLNLQSQGAHNINLVTPTPWLPQITDALLLAKPQLKIPVVYNCGGFERPDILLQAKEYIDIFLTDIKYFSKDLSFKYSGTKDYFEYACNSAKTMLDITGSPVFDNNGILKKGTIIRHLVLPGCRSDSKKIIDFLAENFNTSSFLFSLMSQYTPCYKAINTPPLNRRISSFEYNDVLNYAIDKGLIQGYMQQKSSAKHEYTPPFDLTGI